jgi:hypothetical protein
VDITVESGAGTSDTSTSDQFHYLGFMAPIRHRTIHLSPALQTELATLSQEISKLRSPPNPLVAALSRVIYDDGHATAISETAAHALSVPSTLNHLVHLLGNSAKVKRQILDVVFADLGNSGVAL